MGGGDLDDLVSRRDAARAARDFATADRLRDEIAASGFDLVDTPGGTQLVRRRAFEPVDPASIENRLGEPATCDLSIHLLYEGFLSDLERFLDSFAATNATQRAEIVVVDNAGDDGDAVARVVRGRARALHLDREVGWAAARNAGLKTSAGAVIALADLSIEPAGDIVTPLVRAFDDPAVGVAGPYGLVSENMRLWAESDGPEVDAIEGYLLATRRSILESGLVHEKFKWYRNADIDLSFQVRALGYRAEVVSVPVRKHTHRGWDALDEQERAKRSKRNHYTFFDRWKHREDLLLANRKA